MIIPDKLKREGQIAGFYRYCNRKGYRSKHNIVCNVNTQYGSPIENENSVSFTIKVDTFPIIPPSTFLQA